MPPDDGDCREPALASLDALGDSEQLRVAAGDEIAASAGRVDTSPEGRDESGAVAVTVDRQGRVVDVTLSNWWREHLEPAALGAALFQAYTSATTRTLTAMAVVALSGGDLPDRPSRASGSGSWRDASEDAAAGDPVGDGDSVGDGDDRRWLRDVEERIGQVGWELDRVERMREDAAGGADQERVVSGPYGYVRVTVRGREVSGVEVDARGAVDARPERLAGDAREAFRAAG